MMRRGIRRARRAWRTVLEHVETRLLERRAAPRRSPARRARPLGRARRRPLERARGAARARGARAHPHRRPGSGPNAGAIIIATPGGGMSALMRLQVAATRLPGRRHRAHPTHPRDLRRGRPRRGDAARPTSHPQTPCSTRWTPPTSTPAEFLALDAAFHLALAEASGNQVHHRDDGRPAQRHRGVRTARALASHRRLARDLRSPARRAPRHRRRRSSGGCRDRAHPHPRPHLGLLRRDVHRPDPPPTLTSPSPARRR